MTLLSVGFAGVVSHSDGAPDWIIPHLVATQHAGMRWAGSPSMHSQHDGVSWGHPGAVGRVTRVPAGVPAVMVAELCPSPGVTLRAV